MKKLFLTIILILACFASACNKQPDAVDSQGKAISFSDYRGKWLVVNYWATWCKPCLTELPELNALYAAHQDKLVVLGISFDHLPNTEIQQFAQPLQLKFPLLSQFPTEKFGIKDIPTLPVTFLISPQGKLTQTLYGPQTKASLLTAMELK
ncbi:MAG TPA: TlpA disulfide reductase family protein [Gammaproteobacteria bacterium]|nr:TlpA disulfide reductase family protein [Gammaproteobacteria bacterium]